jgi:hypothetical protein
VVFDKILQHLSPVGMESETGPKDVMTAIQLQGMDVTPPAMLNQLGPEL